MKNLKINVGGRKSYGFFPQMKAEGMAFAEEKSACVVVGTNPGWQMAVVTVEDDDDISESGRMPTSELASGELHKPGRVSRPICDGENG